MEPELARILGFDVRGIAFRKPPFPALDCLRAAAAATVSRIDEITVGEPHPSEAAARPAVFQRTVEDGDGTPRLERGAADASLE